MTVAFPEPAVLWTPSPEDVERANLTRYRRWLRQTRDLELPTYDELWRWSVTDLDGFWRSIWDFFEVCGGAPPGPALAERRMPGARWFPGARLNYAAHALRGTGGEPALVCGDEAGNVREVAATELRDEVARVAAGLRRLGVGPGDRVVAYLPSIAETTIAFLATASIGAVWSSCAPEFGVSSVVDRFRQIEPKVLLAVDGYRYNGKAHDRREALAEIRASLPALAATVVLPQLGGEVPGTVGWDELRATPAELEIADVAFDHPLWVLYSSGTTGLPKPIVQGHGGILLEHLKAISLHLDLGPGDRFFWYTTTGWMMWNLLVGGLLVGATVLQYDGSPGHPDLQALWRFAADTRMTYFGTSAAFVLACKKAGIDPAGAHDLAALRGIGSTGSPLPPEGFEWLYEHVRRDVLVGSISGGTDVCTAFVGSCPVLQVRAGEIQCRCLGAKVEAFDEQGRPVIDQVGELVLTEPLPSMPLRFWDDPGDARYHASYFDAYPGVWRHGDWIRITARGSCVISGRSDSTLNRGGVRMGTAEFYRAVEALDEVTDSLVVESDGRLLVFVVLRPGARLDEELTERIGGAIRRDLSPRHVPDEVHAIGAVPRTLSGKKLEVPVKRILAGVPVVQAVSEGALANPGALSEVVALARLRVPPPADGA